MKLKDPLYILTAAILTYLSLPNIFNVYGFPALGWISLIPLIFTLQAKSLKDRFKLGLLFGIVFYLLLIQWLRPISIVGYIFFAITVSIQPIVFALFFRLNFKRQWLNVFYLPSLWVFSELIRTEIFDGFQWSLGYSQSFIPTLIQIADITGAPGVSFMLVLINVCLYKIFSDRPNRIFFASAGVSIFLMVVFYGQIRLDEKPDQPGSQYSVCSIQPNISMTEKANPELFDVLVQKHLDLTEQCMVDSQPDLTIWPETALTDDVMLNETLNKKVRLMARKLQGHLLVGSALFQDGKDYNAAVLFNKKMEIQHSYRKRKLIPFSEYYPWNKHFFKKTFYGKEYEFHSGKIPGLIALTKQQSIGVMICSEDFYSSIFREMLWLIDTPVFFEQPNHVVHETLAPAPGFAVVMLNNAWFEQPQALLMHLQGSIMQAASFKMPIVRSANTGISGYIDHNGVLQAPLKDNLFINQEKIFHFNVTNYFEKTFYAKFGDIFSILCGVFVIIVSVAEKRKNVRRTTYKRTAS